MLGHVSCKVVDSMLFLYIQQRSIDDPVVSWRRNGSPTSRTSWSSGVRAGLGITNGQSYTLVSRIITLIQVDVSVERLYSKRMAALESDKPC